MNTSRFLIINNVSIETSETKQFDKNENNIDTFRSGRRKTLVHPSEIKSARLSYKFNIFSINFDIMQIIITNKN